MINQIGSFEDIGEKGQSAIKNTAKTAKQGSQNFVKTATGQVSGNQSSTPQNDQGTSESSSSASQQQISDDDAKKFLHDLYGVNDKSTSQPGNQNNTNNPSQNPQAPAPVQNVKTALGLTDSGSPQGKVPTPKETIKTALGIPDSKPAGGRVPTTKETIKNAMGIPDFPVNQKTPEEQAKIEALRSQLHGQYYQDLTNRKKPEEEHVTEKLEREGQEEKMTELEIEKKKPPKLPVNVKQGTGENVVGVSG